MRWLVVKRSWSPEGKTIRRTGPGVIGHSGSTPVPAQAAPTGRATSSPGTTACCKPAFFIAALYMLAIRRV